MNGNRGHNVTFLALKRFFIKLGGTFRFPTERFSFFKSFAMLFLDSCEKNLICAESSLGTSENIWKAIWMKLFDRKHHEKYEIDVEVEEKDFQELQPQKHELYGSKSLFSAEEFQFRSKRTRIPKLTKFFQRYSRIFYAAFTLQWFRFFWEPFQSPRSRCEFFEERKYSNFRITRQIFWWENWQKR